MASRSVLSMRSQLVPLLVQRMHARGLEREARDLLVELSVPEPTNTGGVPEVTLSIGVYRTFCERVALLLADPFLGLHVALERPRGRYGILEFAVRSSPTLADALDRVTKYLPLLSDALEVKVITTPAGASVVHRIAGERIAAGRHANEYGLATILHFGRETSGAHVVPDRVCFAHSKPRDISELTDWFGTDVIEFDCGDNRLDLGAKVLSAPVTSHDPALLALLETHADKGLPKVESAEPVKGLRRRIKSSLGSAPAPSLESIAAVLRVSPRTLQRRLSEAGTTFQSELDHVREELAVAYLAEPSRSIYEIGLMVGYAEQGAFERAFRRWRGATPRQFRKALKA